MIPLLVILAAAPVSVAVPGVSCVGMSQQLCDSFLDRFVAVTATSGGDRLRIVTQRDIAQVLGLERQRQLLGCSDSSKQCLVELAGALGVDGILSMSITRSDPYFVATARVVRTRDGLPWMASTHRVEREGDLFDVMDTIANEFTAQLTGGPVGVATASAISAKKILPWAPGVLGVGAIAGGVGVFLAASSERTALEKHQPVGMDIAVTVEGGRTKQQLGVALMVAGGAGVAVSTLWVLLSGSSKTSSAAIVPVSGGAALVFEGALP